MSPDLIKALMVTAEVYGKEFSAAAAEMLATDLAEYPTTLVLKSLARCRRELRAFPTLADILARIDDGRPGVEEAWAMIPKDEASSVVWTEEMRGAFGTVRHLLGEDPIAARMAFREVYQKLTAEARAERRPVNWEASLGHDRTLREGVVREAVEKGRLTYDQSALLLPASIQPTALRLSGPKDSGLEPMDVKSIVAKIREQIESGGAA